VSSLVTAVHLFQQTPDVGGQDPAGAAFTVSAAVWTAIISVVIPLLTGLITKLGAHPLLKTAVTAVLSVVSAGVQAATVLPDGTAVVSWNTVVLAIVQFVGACVAYWSVWRHSVAGGTQPIDVKLAPNSGIGKPHG